MDLNEILMHYRAARESGEERSCGDKNRYSSEASASNVANKLNDRVEVKIGMRHRLEAYPCPFCFQWHTGREMPNSERGRWYRASDSQYEKESLT